MCSNRKATAESKGSQRNAEKTIDHLRKENQKLSDTALEQKAASSKLDSQLKKMQHRVSELEAIKRLVYLYCQPDADVVSKTTISLNRLPGSDAMVDHP